MMCKMCSPSATTSAEKTLLSHHTLFFPALSFILAFSPSSLRICHFIAIAAVSQVSFLVTVPGGRLTERGLDF